MPNWTYNRITIKGEKDALKKFMTDAKMYDGELFLSSWMPTPETYGKYDTTNHPYGEGLVVGKELFTGLLDLNGTIITEELIEEYKQATKEQKEKYGAVGWYDYNKMTFGCKWDSEVEVESESDEEIILTTDTPWNAPDNWLIKLSEKYPELHFNNFANYEEGFWEETEYCEGRESSLGGGEYEFEEED